MILELRSVNLDVSINHKLPIEKGRFVGSARNDRICIFECSFLKNDRIFLFLLSIIKTIIHTNIMICLILLNITLY